jgi:hypothetical protein
MLSGPQSRRLAVWTLVVAFCALGMAYTQLPYVKLPVVGTITYFEVVLLPIGLLGVGPLMRIATARERSGARTTCRVLIVYLAFELLVVIPVAIWLGMAKPTAILSELAARVTWLLFPVMLALCADAKARRIAGVVAVAAAVCLIAWGLYSAATGGAGWYLEFGDLRYRVLYGGALVLFAWPFVLALSRDISRRSTIPLLLIPLVGLVLTNMRSGYIAAAIAGLACLVMSKQLRRVVPWFVPAALIAVVVVLLWGHQASDALGYTMSHLLDLSSGNGADRVTRDVLAWNFFLRYPFNDYVWSWRYYLVYVQDPYGAHNFVMDIAVTEGIAGLAFYGSMLWVALRHAWSWARKDTEARILVGYLILYIVFQLANGGWYEPVNMALFVAATAALVARTDRLRAADASGVPADDAVRGSRDPGVRHTGKGLSQHDATPEGGDPS